MAITFGAKSEGQTSSETGSLTFSATVSAGSNRLLVVSIEARHDAIISGITFDDVPLTKAINISGPSFMQAEVWYLIGPNVTTANVVASYTASGTFQYLAGCAQSFFGVAQSSLVDDTDTNSSAAATAISLSGLTTVTDGCLIVDAVAWNGGATTMTAETNRTNTGMDQATWVVGSSRLVTKSPAGAVTMEWTNSGSVQVALAAAAFKPASEAPPEVSRRSVIIAG